MKHPETDIQVAVKKHLDAIGCLYNASCAGLKTSMMQAVIAKRMGSKKGFPDLFIYEKRSCFSGLAIEIKSSNGKASPEQIEWHKQPNKRGFLALICPKFKTDKECFDWAIKTIDDYLKLGD